MAPAPADDAPPPQTAVPADPATPASAAFDAPIGSSAPATAEPAQFNLQAPPGPAPELVQVTPASSPIQIQHMGPAKKEVTRRPRSATPVAGVAPLPELPHLPGLPSGVSVPAPLPAGARETSSTASAPAGFAQPPQDAFAPTPTPSALTPPPQEAFGHSAPGTPAAFAPPPQDAFAPTPTPSALTPPPQDAFGQSAPGTPAAFAPPPQDAFAPAPTPSALTPPPQDAFGHSAPGTPAATDLDDDGMANTMLGGPELAAQLAAAQAAVQSAQATPAPGSGAHHPAPAEIPTPSPAQPPAPSPAPFLGKPPAVAPPPPAAPIPSAPHPQAAMTPAAPPMAAAAPQAPAPSVPAAGSGDSAANSTMLGLDLTPEMIAAAVGDAELPPGVVAARPAQPNLPVYDFSGHPAAAPPGAGPQSSNQGMSPAPPGVKRGKPPTKKRPRAGTNEEAKLGRLALNRVAAQRPDSQFGPAAVERVRSAHIDQSSTRRVTSRPRVPGEDPGEIVDPLANRTSGNRGSNDS